MIAILKHYNFNYLIIEYEQKLFVRWLIDNLTDNIVERLKVSWIEQSFILEYMKLIPVMPILVS